MPKRISDEQRIVDYFSVESIDKVEVLYNIVQGIMRRRTQKPTAVRKPKAKAAESAAS